MSEFLRKRYRSNSSSRSSDTSNSQSSAVKKAKTEYNENIQKFIDKFQFPVEKIHKKDYQFLQKDVRYLICEKDWMSEVTPTKKKNETKNVVMIYIFYNYVSSNSLNVLLLFSSLKYLKLPYKYLRKYLDFLF